ncbi:hypothetical protein ACW6QP_01595 [Salegentibacter sp. HM20]
MDLDTRKILFVQDFLKLQNEEIIVALENFLLKRKLELLEENLKPMSVEEYERELDQAMEDSRNGRMIKASGLKEEIKKWS